MDNYLLSNEGRVFLSNYANNLETEIDGKFPYMALINRELCGNIYSKYKDLFELICSEVSSGKDKCDEDIYSFYKTYRKVLNTILLSSGKNTIYEVKPTGNKMLDALVKDKKIIPNDTNYGEFLYETKGVQFEVAVKCVADKIYCIARYFIGINSYVCDDSFDTLNSALSRAILIYNEKNQSNTINSSINSLSVLRLRANNKSCNELWNDK